MRKAGIQEARQNLSALIEAVKKEQEVLITDRGMPVARLGSPEAARQNISKPHQLSQTNTHHPPTGVVHNNGAA